MIIQTSAFFQLERLYGLQPKQSQTFKNKFQHDVFRACARLPFADKITILRSLSMNASNCYWFVIVFTSSFPEHYQLIVRNRDYYPKASQIPRSFNAFLFDRANDTKKLDIDK